MNPEHLKYMTFFLNFGDLSEYFPLISTFFIGIPLGLAFFPVILSTTMPVEPNNEDGLRDPLHRIFAEESTLVGFACL